MESAPAPGEWHPWYQDKPWLMRWLNDRSSLYYRVPVTRIPIVSLIESDPLDFSDPKLLLTKNQAWTTAPWAEKTYVYCYNVATDQYGRRIAGDVWIEYVGNYDRFLAYVNVSEWVT